MKTIKLFFCLLLAVLLPRFASALIVGPYTPDANTLHLWHLDETTTPCVDSVAGGTNLMALVGGATLGTASYSTNANNFVNALNTGAQTNAVLTSIGVGTNSTVTYQGASGAFTYEAVIHVEFDPTANYGVNTLRNQPFQILNYDGNGGATARAFQLRIDPIGFQAGTGDTSSNICRIEFIRVNSSPWLLAPIPTTGPDAIVTNGWYHIAVSYNGIANTTSNLLFYWTAMDPTRASASLIWGTNLTASLQATTGSLLTIGNGARNPSGGVANPMRSNFPGKIDEVRMSSVARGANQMMFAPATVAITQQPIGQEGVDYGGTGVLTVGATSALAMNYQWRQGNVPINGATNTTYTFTNATSANAGNYTCVITNVNASSITSSVASVVIGAANFLTNRYSFTTDASDSIGGQNGTVVGGTTFNGNGTLTLDGSSGFVQLPTNMINTNAGAITVETWATFATIANNTMLFAFGNTNGTSGYNYMFATPHGGTARMALTAGTYTGEQGAAGPSPLDNSNNVQLVCVFAPDTGTESLYVNGMLVATNTNVTLPLSSVIDNFSFLGHSLFSADPYLACTLNEFRVYNGALSAASVLQSYQQGPDTILSDGPVAFLTSPASASTAQGLPVTFSSLTSGHQPILYQWLKNNLPIPNATNSSYTYSPTFADNNASFKVLATNTIGATTYSATSGAATLTVSVPSTLTWFNNSQDSAWNLTSGNWNAGGTDYGQYDGAVFNDSDVNNSTPGSTIDLQFAATPISMVVSNTAENYQFSSFSQNGSLGVIGTLTKQGPGMLTLDVTNNSTGPIYVQSGTLQIGNGDTVGSLGSGPVTNNGSLQFNRTDGIGVPNDLHGTGQIILNSGSITPTSTNNDYTGGTLLNSGILFATTPVALGGSNNTTTVNNGAQVYITANVNIGPEALSLNGAGDGNGALRKGAAGLTALGGAVTLTGNTSIGLDGGATLVLSNTVSGAAALTAIGAGALTLNTNNTFSGGFTLNGPVVTIGSQGALGTASLPVAISGPGRFVIRDGVNVTNNILAGTVSPGVATGLLMVNDNTNGTVTTISGWVEVDNTAVNGNDFLGPITSGYLNVVGPVTNPVTQVVGSRNGFVRFSGGGSYTIFILNQGTASIGANNGLCTNTTITMAGSGAATLDLNGFNQTLTGISDGAANAELVTNSAATVKTLTLNVPGSDLYSGLIGGKLALVVNGPGSLDLTGLNTYTGNTTINGGLLELGQPGLAAASTVTVASGATLQLDFATTNQVAGLVLNGVSQPLGVYNNNNASPYINGAGSLLVGPTVNTTPTNITTSVNNGSLILNWPADHIGWRLLVQTDSPSTGLNPSSNAWFTVTGSTTVDSVTNVINPANGPVFYRLVYP